MPFSVGVNYWPHSHGMAMWRRFDAGEIREDFARIAALGLDTVRFFLRWDDFAPHADAVDPIMLDRLDDVVTLADVAGLQTVPTLFCGHAGGVHFVPAWALDRTRPRGRFPTIAGEAESPYGIGDIYRGALLAAQLRLARAVGERVRDHRAVRAWDIGNRFSNLREPPAGRLSSGEHSTEPAGARVVAEWSKQLAAALTETSARPVTGGTHDADVTQERNLRLASACAPFAFASMQGSTVDNAFARSRLDPEVVPFLAMLAAAFSYKPVMVSAFGNPTCPPDKFSAFEHFAAANEPDAVVIAPDDTAFATYPCLSEDDNAGYCTRVLERLHADGRLGAYWWCWADEAADGDDPSAAASAPYERTFGVIRSDGSEKPVAAALSAFARQRREVTTPDEMPMLATTYYYRTLPAATHTLYDAFLLHVGDRRAAQ